MSKVFSSPEAALTDIAVDGMTVLSGGFGLSGIPENLIDALRTSGVRGLTVVSNNCGAEVRNGDQTVGFGLWQLLANNQIDRVIGSYVGANKLLESRHLAGEVDLELTPQGTLAERIRAGGAGIPAFFTKTGVGTELARGKRVERFDGQDYLLEHAITGDLALVKAWRGDPEGNLVYRMTARNFNPEMATAGRVTVAEVEELVPLGALDANAIHTPGIYVDRIVQGPGYGRVIEGAAARTAVAA